MSRGVFVFIFIFLGASVAVNAQETDSTEIAVIDSTVVEDSIIEKEKKPHSPKLATVLSAVVPGAGQVYNRKYWKLPIIYGAFGGLIYSVVFNHQKFRLYKDAYLLRVDEDPTTIDQFDPQLSTENLLSLQTDYRRNRDLSYIFTGIFYALNIIDAAVDAHLFHFDVNEDLSLRVEPKVHPIPYQDIPTVGVGITLSLP